ncbi:MAG: type II toxin-antitoxin system prevent-host-death family antitoxin [Candidatus Gracilibacteria bacterium]|nr:type II toxin-antitoxin system prevent-host-death family antitoxin [Candidatus Gracilibacteria bacterium]
MGKIIESKYISATELKNKTKNVLDMTDDLGEVYIMNNNKPKAVIVSIERYNYLNNYNIPEVEPDEFEINAIKEYEKQKKDGTLEFIEGDEVFSFLNSLK